MKYTAQQLKHSLIKNDAEARANFKVNKYDREYQIWKREPLSIDLISADLFKQKLEYLPARQVIQAGITIRWKQDYAKTRKIIIIQLQDFTMMDWTLLKCWHILQVIDRDMTEDAVGRRPDGGVCSRIGNWREHRHWLKIFG